MVDKQMTTVSVVIPAYNAEKYIAKAIESVLGQTYPVHQLIVVNDGSTDGTAAILETYRDRIDVISIPNGGVSNARNTGLKQAHGELIALLDADDLWGPEKLERQVAVFREHAGVEFTCCNYLSVDTQTQRTGNQFDYLAQSREPFFDKVLTRPVDLLLAVNFVGTCSNVMFTRALLERVGLFDTGLRQAEDFDLWLRMALETDFYLQSTPLLEKVAHGANLTSRFDETLKFHEIVVQRFRAAHPALFDATPTLEAVYRRGLADVRYEIAGILFAKGRRGEAFSYLRTTWAAEHSMSNAGRIVKRAVRRLVWVPDLLRLPVLLRRPGV